MKANSIKLSNGISFNDLYSVNGLRKIDSYFIERLLLINPTLCNKLLDARLKPLFKLDESQLIIDLAPHLERFIAELFCIEEAINKLQSQNQKLDIIYNCNKHFIQKYILNLNNQSLENINIIFTKAALLAHGVLLPVENYNIIECEIDMAEMFWHVYHNAISENQEWSLYHQEILRHVENYSLWAIFSSAGQNLHKDGALFNVAKKLDYNNLIPNLHTYHSTEEITVTNNGKNLAWIIFVVNFQIPTLLERYKLYPTYCCMSEETKLEKHKKTITSLIYTTSIFSLPLVFINKYNNSSKQKHFQLRVTSQEKQIIIPKVRRAEYLQMDTEHLRTRHSFTLNDITKTTPQILYEANYCLYCHNRAKDSCAQGMKTTTGYKTNPLNIELTGCPLEQKISEMHYLKAKHNIIGALATIMIDNPMVAATGHRICNDCIKGCIFQKQEAINTPLVETSILKDVLLLPLGFEIYSLLSRWNPLNFSHPLPKEVSNYKVLVVGMGPAGFTLAHYLLNAGINVVGIDGLKIEPLPGIISGINQDGTRCDFKPIYNIKKIFENLETKKPKGFGGVMEYGITVRWDKNLLDVVRLLLLRRQNFRMYDGIRFGSNLTYDLCQDIGFNHIAFAVGAGSPNLPEINNRLIKGVRLASDFLMSLHSTGAYRAKTVLPLQIRMPIVIVGAGLTAVDVATEAIQYYLIQIKKFFHQYNTLGDKFLTSLSLEDRNIAKVFISHAKQLKKQSASKLLAKWGGVTIIYRKKMQDSPAYKINHEELAKAFEEGIKFIENAIPMEIQADEFGHCKMIICKSETSDIHIPAQSVIIATGTQPNTMVSKEEPRLDNNPNISYFGDANPEYNGSVVKAMASAKNGYKKIVTKLNNIIPNQVDIFKKLDECLISSIVKVVKLTSNVVEIIVKSPAAAANFKPGQFFKFQTYEVNALHAKGYNFPMEGIALTGADIKNETISLIVLELGVSSKLCNTIKSGTQVVLMGPVGMPTHIPYNETVILIGGGLGNAVLMSIGKQMRAQGCKVIYFAGYKKLTDRFKVTEIENAADTVIWCCDEGFLSLNRESDKSFHGNMINALKGNLAIIKKAHRMIVIGSDKLMSAVAEWRKKSKIKCAGIASINSPMNCMMKEICAQCLQKHIIGKKEIYIYSCANQDQNIDTTDFKHLEMRLQQNSLLEKTANAFYDK